MTSFFRRRWCRLSVMALVALTWGGACQRQSAAPVPPPASADEGAVRDLVKLYFESWSAKDITTYGECFSPYAQIWYAGQPPLALNPFLETQRQAHQNSPVPMTEDPLDIAVTIHNGLAHAQIHWELHQGADNVRGYDFMTLAQTDGHWQIVALVFKEEKP